MCGIAGFYNKESQKSSAETVKKMVSAIYHRGPDSQGFFESDYVHLGNCRLSIIDLKTGDQPVFNEDRTITLVFNGEIYNFLEIREGLLKRGHKFRSASDTETVVHLYEEKGVDCLRDLNGMFALALWDANKKILFLARDRLGVKPLIWSWKGNNFAFASEIKGLLPALNFKPVINGRVLSYYFTFGFIPAPLTIYQDIFKLEPAHYLLFDGKKVVKKSYWQAPRETHVVQLEKAKQELYKLTQEAVKRRLIADVPLGAFLSGGFDSSIVVGLMKKLAGSVETFSIGFEGPSFFNELPQAQRVAKFFGVKNYSEVISAKTVRDLIPEVLDKLDEPFADSSIIPTYLLSKITRQKVKVALSGDGGDEIFVGYSKYQGHYWSRYISPLFLLRLVDLLPVSREGGWGEFIRKLVKFKKGAEFSLPERHFIWTAVGDSSQLLKEQSINPKDFYLSLFKDKDSLEQALLVDFEFNLPDDMLTKVDSASMQNSLEVRSPFLDYTLAEFMLSLPVGIRFRGGKLKYLAKETFKDLLPHFVLDYRKQGFEIPIGEWLRSELKEQFLELIKNTQKQWGDIVNFDVVGNIFTQHLKKRADHSKTLWALFMLGYWTNKHL